jgi:single-stranded-DNA-specific exonuclease
MKKYWKYREKVELPDALVEVCGSKTVATLLANRGILEPETAEAFLNLSDDQFSSPDEFVDMPIVVNRIETAIENQEPVLIWGDFDADGITGTSILLKTLQYIGANVSYYIPERVHEGHGINTTSLLKLISTRKIKLVITIDCGVSNYNEIDLAKNFGVETIITDHHELPEVLPPAIAIINSKMLQPDSKMAQICGAGVAYKVSEALLKRFNKNDLLEDLLYLAAIGTIADLVPLKHENRLIAKKGLDAIRDKQPAAIVQIAKKAGIPLDENFNSVSIAFFIAPRLNAIGRLDYASNAVDLLTTSDPEKLEILASKLEQINRERQQLCDKTYEEALMMLKETDLTENKAIVLANKEWHPGVIGIVASMLVEKFYRPVFLMSIEKNEARGSARSIPGLHLFNTLNKISELFIRFGGHELAAGFNLNIDNLNTFKKSIIEEVNKEFHNLDPQPYLNVEMDIKPDELSLDLMEKIKMLEPFGQDNPEPVLCCSNLSILNFRMIGADNNHLKINLKSPDNKYLEALWWQKSALEFDVNQPVKVAFYPEINNYMSKLRIQLIVKDMMPIYESNELSQKTKNAVKWIDHRNKTDITRLIKNYVKTTDSKIAIFAESNQYKSLINNNCDIINRNCQENYYQIIFLEYPPEDAVIKDLLRQTKPEIVHLAPAVYYKPQNEVEIFKTVYSMLKYASKQKNSEASVLAMASKLGTSVNVILSSVDALLAAGLIEVISYKGDCLKFRLTEFKMINIADLKEIDRLKTELQKVYKFRKEFISRPVEDFQYY